MHSTWWFLLLVSRLLPSRQIHATQVAQRCLKTQLDQAIVILNLTFFTSYQFLLPLKISSTSMLVPTTLLWLDVEYCLVDSTIAASVIFGYARHAKTVAAPRNRWLTAWSCNECLHCRCCLGRAFSMEWLCSCLIGAAFRNTGSFAVFPAHAVQAAFPSPRRWCFVDPPRRRLDGAQTWSVFSPTS